MAEEKKQEYLTVDPAVPGQDWCVLSFVTPGDLKEKRDVYMMDHFLNEAINDYVVSSTRDMCRRINAKFFKEVDQKIEQMKQSKNEDHKVLGQQLHQIRKELETDEEEFAKLCTHQHGLDQEETMAKYQEFMVRRGSALEEEFSKENKQGVSTMGVKFSGAFAHKEQAVDRAEFLAKEVERGVDHFVGQSFHWLPFNPDPNAIEDQKYQNEDLNKLMEEKQKNEMMKDRMFEERKREMMSEAEADNQSIRERLRKKYQDKKLG